MKDFKKIFLDTTPLTYLLDNDKNFGEIIEQYPNDYPYPSCLICGKNISGEIIHIVLSDEGNSSRIITAYFPDADKWSKDFKNRR